MTLEDFKAEYPHLYQTMENLAADNQMKLFSSIELPFFLTPSLKLAETQASQLSDDEKQTFAMGDDDERQALVQSTGFEHLDDFISEAFEGILTDLMFQPPKLQG
jgi:hypothetical protein